MKGLNRYETVEELPEHERGQLWGEKRIPGGLTKRGGVTRRKLANMIRDIRRHQRLYLAGRTLCDSGNGEQPATM